jgi:hypothetical protein
MTAAAVESLRCMHLDIVCTYLTRQLCIPALCASGCTCHTAYFEKLGIVPKKGQVRGCLPSTNVVHAWKYGDSEYSRSDVLANGSSKQ